MRLTVFVSNRLAVRVARDEDEIRYVPSVGGLATGLSSVASDDGEETLWVGWSGIPEDELAPAEQSSIRETLRNEHGAIAVPISSAELELFYAGFCNDTIWPLFHYFPTYTEYNRETWESYREINQRFFDVLAPEIRPGARVWVHDYQLMLLPGLIKERFPDVEVGFFLHIPFPSYEIFRLLPWREAVLEGLLGADLIGFHTYDYARHFLSSVRRLLGHDHSMGVIQTDKRAVKVDVFPMGIDWDRFVDAGDTPVVQEMLQSIREQYAGRKLVLSVDRLDYSKGIPTRIRAFGRLLERHPEMMEVVTLFVVVSPSRESVPRYLELKREVDELVSDINGRFSRLNWMPIHYQYQTASFDELSALYRRADLLLVTPLRDGMNLIAKEYLAARTDNRGALIISETAGAARELSEATQVNPSDIDGIADAIHDSLTEDESEQEAHIGTMRERLKRLTVQYWATDFLEKLEDMKTLQASYGAQTLNKSRRSEIVERWNRATRRLLFLDYDGTLQRFFRKPSHAKPDDELLELLSTLGRQNGVQLVISSGRDRDNLQEWFGHYSFGLGAGHGAWIREPGQQWEAATLNTPEWKETIAPIVEQMVDRTPGSAMEQKDFSLAWHYRNCEPELANVRLAELRETLIGLTSNLDLSVLDGNRVLEVKPTHIHKGRVVHHFAGRSDADFVMAIGDDATDEYMFQAMPQHGISIKVGVGTTAAQYSIDGVQDVRAFLRQLVG
ncbi:MAG: bifunctional alpha,alpha-trehalose-phosphate synthase (UDP-forming)/trehalose-phosphatase, partial [Spirochaeta sp.]|nr:bifunctional alpha,alpha-trehalose-phosphate synthase (UDP-forming)/trehalose-phosphatase [Spirochaeta sp.]